MSQRFKELFLHMYYLYNKADVECIMLLGVNRDVNEVVSW